MFTDKILEIEKKLEQDGYKFYNKGIEDAQYIYYHNPKEDLIDLSFNYIMDNWEFYYNGKSKMITSNKFKKLPKKFAVEGDSVKTSTITKIKTYRTEELHDLFIAKNKDVLDIVSE